MDKDNLSAVQAAEFLGYEYATLAHSRWTGVLGGVTAPPYRKVGRLVKYSRTDLAAWIMQFETQTVTDKAVK